MLKAGCCRSESAKCNQARSISLPPPCKTAKMSCSSRNVTFFLCKLPLGDGARHEGNGRGLETQQETARAISTSIEEKWVAGGTTSATVFDMLNAVRVVFDFRIEGHHEPSTSGPKRPCRQRNLVRQLDHPRLAGGERRGDFLRESSARRRRHHVRHG